MICGALLCGCAAPTLTLRVTVPAKTRIVGVRGVAVGGFKAENLDAWQANAEGAGWNKHRLPESDLRAISDGVKNDLLGKLAETPFYSVMDLEGQEKIFDMDGLAGLVGQPTFKPGTVDALIFGRCWVGYLEADGVKHEKVTLEDWDYRSQVPRITASREELVTSDYKTASAVLVVQYTAVRFHPRLEILFVTTTVQSLRQDEGGGIVINKTRGGPLGMLGMLGGGGSREGKSESSGSKPAGGTVPLALEVFSYLSHEAANGFVEQISPTTREVQIELAEGDKTAANLIRAGAYREASRLLRQITEDKKKGTLAYKKVEDRAPDLYNLGLSWEAQGPAFYEDAIVAYRKAVEADPETVFFASGLGRIARLMEGTNLIEMQKGARNE
ncbi:MAG: tetratricopeptide repeat protein [Planctomycetota bacterium]